MDKGLGRNYLDAYTVTLDPQGADVAWGEVAWEAWADLTCESTDYVAMEQVDVCAMFEAEVDRLPTPDAVPVLTSTGDSTEQSNIVDTQLTLAGFNLAYEDADDSRHRFTAMWYVRGKEDKPPNLYADLAATTAFVETNMVVGATEVDDSDDVVEAGSPAPWVATLDKDFDPIYGDLGKVDLFGDDKADTFVTADDSNACSADDGGTAKSAGVNNGTLCDVDGVEIETTVIFPLGLGYGCENVEKTYTLTCDWSTRGNRNNSVSGGGIDLADVAAGEPGHVGDFVSCDVE